MPEIDVALAWEEWRANPCGRPEINLDVIPALLQRMEDAPAKTVALKTPAAPSPEVRAQAVQMLQRVRNADTAFPAAITGYFEGQAVVTRGKKPEWILEIYGEGDPPALQPEPDRPAYAQ